MRARMKIVFSILLIIIFSFNFLAFAVTSQEIAENTFPSVVLMLMRDENNQPLSLGSGFFVEDNIVATNFHVLSNAQNGYVKVVGKDKKYSIEGILASDEKRDLVLVKIEKDGFPVLPKGNSTSLSVGEKVYAAGNPMGLEGTFSDGIISGIRQFEEGSLLQITAPISPGSSGGPILNQEGKVIGLAVATYQDGQNLNFAVPVEYLNELLENKSSNIKPLSEQKIDDSVAYDFGNKSIEGVEVIQFRFDELVPRYSFSIMNKTERNIKNVDYIVIFYDDSGRPIETIRGSTRPDSNYEENIVISSGLSKRFGSFSYNRSIEDIMAPQKTEVRILNYEVAK